MQFTTTFRISLGGSRIEVERASSSTRCSHVHTESSSLLELWEPSPGTSPRDVRHRSHTTHNATPQPTKLTEDSGRTTHEGSPPLPWSFSSFSSPLASVRSSLFHGKIKRRGEALVEERALAREEENREESLNHHAIKHA